MCPEQGSNLWKKKIIYIEPVATYFPAFDLLVTRYHNKWLIHGITQSLLGVCLTSKHHIPLPTYIRCIRYSLNGDKC